MICMKGLEKKQGNNQRIKLFLALTFLSMFVYNIPKCMEYSWNSKTIRSEYDAGDDIWTDLKRKYIMLKGFNHLDFNEKYPAMAALGAEDCE